MEQNSRTQMLIGENAIQKLKNTTVAVFGLGGVGGNVVEALARVGVGKIVLIDNDTVSVSNINRQIIALHSTVGRLKTEVWRDRIKDINPACEVELFDIFVTEENAKEFEYEKWDYCVDAVDTVSAKLGIIVNAQNARVPIISSMGAGNRIYNNFEIKDIYKTEGDALARVMRRELRKREVKSLKTVSSKDECITPPEEKAQNGRHIPGSISFVPGTAGFVLAGEVIRDIVFDCKNC